MKSLAERNGLAFQSIIWNPNYKGIDDWQHALRKSSVAQLTTRSFKEKFLSGECGVGAVGAFAEVWEKGSKELTLPDYLGLLPGEYDVFRREGELGLARILLAQRKTVYYRIYQLAFGAAVHTLPFAFADIETVYKAGYPQPPATYYSLVCDGSICCSATLNDVQVIELLRIRYGNNLPPGYEGRSLAPSDVVELYGSDGRRYFYCNRDGVAAVRFSPMLAQQRRCA